MNSKMIDPQAVATAALAELQEEIQLSDELFKSLKQAKEMILAMNSGMQFSEAMKEINKVISKMEKRCGK